MEQLIKRSGIDAQNCFLAGNQPFFCHLHGNLQRSLRGSLAGARLQHPQFAVLDGEFEILHVGIVLLKPLRNGAELGKRRRHDLFQRWLVRSRCDTCFFGDVLRRANTGNDVLALRVDQKLAVELLFAGRWIAREGNPRRRPIAHIAEYHRLNADGRSPALRNVVQAAIGDRAGIHPAGKNRADRAPKLLFRILRERLFQFLFDLGLIEGNDILPVVGSSAVSTSWPRLAFVSSRISSKTE